MLFEAQILVCSYYSVPIHPCLSPTPYLAVYNVQITELAGYTSRVSEMIHVFEEVDQGRYQVVGIAEDLGEKKEKDGK